MALLFCLPGGHPWEELSLGLGLRPLGHSASSHLCAAPCPAPLLQPERLALCPGTASTRGGHWPLLLPQPRQPLFLPREVGQRAGPWGGRRAWSRVLAPGRSRALATEPHWPGPALSPEVPGVSRGQGFCLGSGPPLHSRLGNGAQLVKQDVGWPPAESRSASHGPVVPLSGISGKSLSWKGE